MSEAAAAAAQQEEEEDEAEWRRELAALEEQPEGSGSGPEHLFGAPHDVSSPDDDDDSSDTGVYAFCASSASFFHSRQAHWFGPPGR